jgi:diaminopimelate decarboxylase
MPLEDGFVLPAVDGAPSRLGGETARAQRTAVAIGLAADIADLEPAAVGLAAVHRAQLLAIITAGAYGAVQSGFYNTRPLVPEVLVKDDQYAVVRPRIEVDELIAMDRQAPWL